MTAIESDGAFAANLLRYVNSAATARPLQAQSVRQAVVMVGRLRIRQLALETGTYGFLESVPGNGPVVARPDAPARPGGRRRELRHRRPPAATPAPTATSAGLLHDFGKLVMPLAFGEDAADQLARDVPRGTARALRERATFGIDHAVAGASWRAARARRRTSSTPSAAHHGVQPLHTRRGRLRSRSATRSWPCWTAPTPTSRSSRTR